MTTVLLLESTQANGSSFAPQLEKRYQLTVAHTRQEALALAHNNPPQVLVLDTTTMRTSGNRLCAQLRHQLGDLPIIHIKPAPDDETSVADVLLYPPFTYRKLCNRINRFTQVTSLANILEVGAFKLNLSTSVLTTPNGEHHLTPKLTKLMSVFLQNPEKVIERRHLIREVWQTDYMGDTRTLDVHMRWMRELVETQASQPQYIKTVRGKGYRFIPDGDTTAKTAK